MGFYQLKRILKVNAPVERVWKFISSPGNLKLITPGYMRFELKSDNLPKKIYKGMIIAYSVKPLMGITTSWITEITHLEENNYFVDEQRVGPYKLWHHQHILEPKGDLTLMTDIVSYKPPLGMLGSLANKIIISKKLNKIFDFRANAIKALFGENNVVRNNAVLQNNLQV